MTTKGWGVPQITGADLEEVAAAEVAAQLLRIHESAKTTSCNNCDTLLPSNPAKSYDLQL